MPKSLIDILRGISPSGPDGLEGLIAELLEALTGHHFQLCSAGYQEGRDMTSRPPNSNRIAIECKRYAKKTDFDELALRGELDQVAQAMPDLDIWGIVTSRDLPSQIQERLYDSAAQKGIEFFSISSGDGSPSSLETLCANSPDTLTANLAISKHTSKRVINRLLTTIASTAEYRTRLNELKDRFSTPLIGYENWRLAQNNWYVNCLKSEREARAFYLQPLNVDDASVKLITRESSRKAMDEWFCNWGKDRNALVILGEEGDGKTWGVASWLSNSIRTREDFPGVILIPSHRFDNQDPGSFILKAMSSRMKQLPEAQLRRRLSRWMDRAIGKSPLILLVIDGINERRDSDWWRELIQGLFGEPWYGQIAVVITCRSFYWQHYGLAELWRSMVTSYTMTPYDERELTIALSNHGLRLSDISPVLRPLIHKPRYFDLIVNLRKRMSESGDITIARLIYEDWNDRFKRKNLTLADSDFKAFISTIAKNYQDKSIPLTDTSVANSLPLISDQKRSLEELRTGGVLYLDNGIYKVDARLLVFGFGLILADQLKQASDNNENLHESISSWLEPHAEMDLKAQICEYAALHSLSIRDYPGKAKVALLHEWASKQNRPNNISSDFTAYFLLDPDSYFALAESIWSHSYENYWAQEMLINAILAGWISPRVSKLLPSVCERWLGYVHILGTPFGRSISSDTELAKKHLSERISHEIQLGPFSFARYPLTIIDNEGLLRLGYAALAIISHLPRKPFIHSIAIGCVSDAIMEYPDKSDLIAWAIRSSSEDIWPEIESEAKHLLQDDNILSKQAAYRLLSFEGTENAHAFRETIPGDIFEHNPLIEKHRQDPCTSIFSWSEEDCVRCLPREDLPPALVAKKISSFCVDPNFNIPDRLITQFGLLINNILPDSLWTHLGQTEADFFFEIIEPILAAFNQEALSRFMLSLISRIDKRRGIV